MRSVVLADEVDFAGWRQAARALALDGVPPEDVVWSVRTADDLFAQDAVPEDPGGSFNVPRALVELADQVVLAREPARFALLYGLLWRAHGGERHLLEQASDPAVQRAQRLAQSVRRDMHKMRAFVRFRDVAEPDGTRHVAWFEPEHHIVEANAPFFVRRFATMRWTILTPERSAHWDGATLRFGPGADPAEVPDDDALELYWRTYFRSIFNPARLKVAAMRSEMPEKYWRNLPEAAAIPDLIRDAPRRARAMVEQDMATGRTRAEIAPIGEVLPPPPADTALGQAAMDAGACRRCSLWEPATQVVFGEGPVDAPLMMVGEQPGDQEDLAGKPFVGPAGRMLDAALAEAGIDRSLVYVTNAVKHFKFEPRGKRRIHAKPDSGEITACRVWLDLERAQVRPKLTLLLGASAAKAVLGKTIAVTKMRGTVLALPDGGRAMVTVHPSYLLRLPDEESKRREYAAFVRDLRQAAELIAA